MSRDMHWFVLTGGPSTGKTTILRELARLGHVTVPEAARWVFDQGIAKGLTPADIRGDEKAFQNAVLRRKIEIEANQNHHVTTFFDRGMHDTVAYLKLHNIKGDQLLEKALRQAAYAKIFVFDTLPRYVEDALRNESLEIAKQLNDLLFEAYTAAGFQTVRIPAISVPDRVALILEHVNTSQKERINS